MKHINDDDLQGAKKDTPNNQNRKISLLIGGVVVLLLLAVWVGFNVGNNGSETTGMQQNKGSKTSLSPEDTLKNYLTAIKDEDYEEAASYISENAKSLDSTLEENPEDWIYQQYRTEPLVRFQVRPIKEEISDSRKLYQADIFVNSSWSGPKQRFANFFLLELENGIWKVNHTSKALSDHFSPLLKD